MKVTKNQVNALIALVVAVLGALAAFGVDVASLGLPWWPTVEVTEDSDGGAEEDE